MRKMIQKIKQDLLNEMEEFCYSRWIKPMGGDARWI